MPTPDATQRPPHFIPALALPFEPDPPPKASAKPARPKIQPRSLPARKKREPVAAVRRRA